MRASLVQVMWDIRLADDEAEGGMAIHRPPSCSVRQPCLNCCEFLVMDKGGGRVVEWSTVPISMVTQEVSVEVL
jgi:hypothetical protein